MNPFLRAATTLLDRLGLTQALAVGSGRFRRTPADLHQRPSLGAGALEAALQAVWVVGRRGLQGEEAVALVDLQCAGLDGGVKYQACGFAAGFRDHAAVSQDVDE